MPLWPRRSCIANFLRTYYIQHSFLLLRNWPVHCLLHAHRLGLWFCPNKLGMENKGKNILKNENWYWFLIFFMFFHFWFCFHILHFLHFLHCLHFLLLRMQCAMVLFLGWYGGERWAWSARFNPVGDPQRRPEAGWRRARGTRHGAQGAKAHWRARRVMGTGYVEGWWRDYWSGGWVDGVCGRISLLIVQ